MTAASSPTASQRAPIDLAVVLLIAAGLVLLAAAVAGAIFMLGTPHEAADGLRLAPFRWGPTRGDLG